MAWVHRVNAKTHSLDHAREGCRLLKAFCSGPRSWSLTSDVRECSSVAKKKGNQQGQSEGDVVSGVGSLPARYPYSDTPKMSARSALV